MRKLRKNTRPSGAEQQHDHQRAAEDGLAERSQSGDLPASDLNGVAAGGLIGQPSHDAGQRHAAGHVVVDADHVGAQTRIDRDLVRAIAGSRGRKIPIEVGHGDTPGLSRSEPGLGVRRNDAEFAWRGI